MGNLTFAPNYPGDSLEKGTGAITLRPPDGVSDTRWIDSLIDAANSYKGDARYGIAPAANNDAYNSNSFVSGVIRKAGGVPPQLPVKAPGYEKPLPLGH